MGSEVFKWLQLCNRDTPHARKRTGGKRGKRHTERSSSSHFAAAEEHTAFILQLKEVSRAERTAPSLAVMRHAGAPYISLLKVTSQQHLLLCPPALTHPCSIRNVTAAEEWLHCEVIALWEMYFGLAV